jgi:hypothetical protein
MLCWLADGVRVDDDSVACPIQALAWLASVLLSSIRVPIMARPRPLVVDLYGTVSSVVTSRSRVAAGVELFIERSHRDGHPPQRATVRRAAHCSSLSKQLPPAASIGVDATTVRLSSATFTDAPLSSSG